MKKSIFLGLLVIVLALSVIGCGKSGTLDGVWTGRVFETEIILAFIDDLCFLVIDRDDVEYSNYTFLKDDGVLVTGLGNMPMTLKSNSLTLTYDGVSVIFVRDASTKNAPSSINGVWKGPRPWVFAFINDKVFIVDDDDDPDFAFYTLNGNSGFFETELYGWEIGFTVRGNTLNTSGVDLEATFTRTR